MMSSNGISDRQNSLKCIKMLAAQRQIYRDCKKYECLIVVFSVLLPFFCAVAQLLFSQNNAINIVTYVMTIAGMFVGVFTAKRVEKMQEQSARIQQLFDLEVYQLPWDAKLFGQNINFNPVIAEKSKKILSEDKEKKLLVEWYPTKYDTLPLKKAIFFCQRANVNWDSNIRSLYRTSCYIVIIIMILVILLTGVINNDSLLFFLSRLVFVIPLMQWLLSKVNSINKDIRRIEKCSIIFLEKNQCSEDDLLIIQSNILNHRESCTLIPDWFYMISKKKQESIMKMTAEVETDEYK